MLQYMHIYVTEHSPLSNRTHITLQWIPSHCGVQGNEEADRLSKSASRMEQPDPPLSYREVKTMIKGHTRDNWKRRLRIDSTDDGIHHLDRHEQVLIFRLRTGHCQLLSHLYNLQISHTPECPCGTGLQTPEHILQTCPTFTALRHQIWPSSVDLGEKLWGPVQSLGRTAEFITMTGLKI